MTEENKPKSKKHLKAEYAAKKAEAAARQAVNKRLYQKTKGMEFCV